MTWHTIPWQTLVPKIIKIQQRLVKLQRKMSGVFFSRHSVDSATTENAKWLVSEITAGMAIIGLKIVRIKAK